jgi:predicted 3-demethylubiquinone-9 3-methyltransferase (glyoxalase superfamily)
MEHAKQKITTFLTFTGKAEEAMNYYISVFDQGEILSMERYAANEDGTPGGIVHATFSLNGQVFICMDSNVKHEWSFTPAVSLYVACTTAEEIDRLFAKLSHDGTVFMELTAYPFSERFAWVADQFGVSWQLNLENSAS